MGITWSRSQGLFGSQPEESQPEEEGDTRASGVGHGQRNISYNNHIELIKNVSQLNSHEEQAQRILLTSKKRKTRCAIGPELLSSI